eukprot:16445707-Heterocapsa_arctica.AAC.1
MRRFTGVGRRNTQASLLERSRPLIQPLRQFIGVGRRFGRSQLMQCVRQGLFLLGPPDHSSDSGVTGKLKPVVGR